MFKYGSKIITLPLLFIILATLLTSCFDDPEFPNEPVITFNDIIYKPRPGSGFQDSLILTIDFEDGDGDLGIGTSEFAPPFNERNYFSKRTGRIIDFQNEFPEDLIYLSDTVSIDTLPPYDIDNFACLFWDEDPDIPLSNGEELDSIVYYQPNRRHNNIIVKFFIDSNNNGVIDETSEEFDFRLIDPQKRVCNTSNDGRFPILDEEALRRPAPLEGSITYAMSQLVPYTEFLGDGLIKLKVSIIDRSGNESNTIETPLFTLDEITAN